MTDGTQPSVLPLSLHASAYPAARRAALLESLRAGRLPGALLYGSPAQAQRWLAYHEAWSPSRTDTGLQGLYARASAAAAERVPGPALVVGLGCGDGRKDADLLAALADAHPGRSLAYAPVDTSPTLAAEAALEARRRVPGVALHPLVADLAAEPALADWLARLETAAGPVRVLTAFGLLPNLPHERFPRWLAGLLRPGDALLVSANLSPGGRTADAARIVAQYDNSPARAWYAGALEELGLPAEAYALEVAAAQLDPPLAGLPADDAWQVAVTAGLHRDVEIALHGEVLRYAAGTRLAVFASRRFTAPAAAALLEGAGLAVAAQWEGAGGEEGLLLCGAAG